MAPRYDDGVMVFLYPHQVVGVVGKHRLGLDPLVGLGRGVVDPRGEQGGEQLLQLERGHPLGALLAGDSCLHPLLHQLLLLFLVVVLILLVERLFTLPALVVAGQRSPASHGDSLKERKKHTA